MKITKLLILAICCIALARFCHHQTKGFRLSKITHNLPLSAEQQAIAGDEPVNMLNQKFYFLSRGLQSFVFVSEDGEYVLKLFNNCHQQRYALYCFARRLTPFAPMWALQKQKKALEKIERTFNSYKIAFDLMQEQTALLYVHAASTTTLPSTLTLVDPLHIEHQINPNKIGFLIQKRVSLAYPTLQQFLDQGDLKSATQALHSLLQLFIWKHQHKIADSDPLIRTNYGFIGTQAIQLDVGPLSLETTPCSEEVFHQELVRITNSLNHFLQPRSQELANVLNQHLQTSAP